MTTCPICKSYMSIKNSIFAHYLSNHDKGQIVRNKIFDDGKCIICKKSFSSFEEFLNHLMNEHVNKTIEIFSSSKKMIEYFKVFVQPISQVTIPFNLLPPMFHVLVLILKRLFLAKQPHQI